jgi:PAS domain S-box-containing protein
MKVDTSIRAALAAALQRFGDTERRRLTHHALALAAVAAAALLGLASGVTGWASFLFFDLAVAAAAWFGGWQPGLVAALAAILVVRLGGPETPAPGFGGVAAVLFAARAIALAYAADAVATRLRGQASELEQAERRLRDLHDRERRGRIAATSLARLQDATSDVAIAVLDRHGRIAEWSAAAARLFGLGPQAACGSSAARLFGAGTTADDFARLIYQARKTPVRLADRPQRRADATEFRADVELRALPAEEGDGFTLLVRDLTFDLDRARRAAEDREARERLLDEAEAAHRQLASLKSVTDPSLNDLGGPELVRALLDRVRGELSADGVALWHERFLSQPIAAPGGVQPRVRRPHPEMTTYQAGRTLLIHNDRPRIAAMSLYQWPDDVSSLITVPVVHAGRLQVIVEVVHRRSGRATEWELALVQVVAERAAGLMNEDAVKDAVA